MFLPRLGGMKNKTPKPFVALEVSLELVAALAPLVRALRSSDPDLARQIRRAGASVPLNISEANSRRGRDRAHLFRVASGSAREVIAALRIALAFGDLSADRTAPALELADRVVAMLYRLAP